MTPADFAYLQSFLKARSGLDLAADKQYLIDSRLNPIARRKGLANVAAIVQALRGGADKALESAVVEAMTTNESFFFRDKTPFDQFRDIIVPALAKSRASARKMRIWCAAASTGQEPYSLAMIIKEMAGTLANWRTEIIGTDLSTEVLEKARAGIYSQFEVQRGLPVQMLVKYFEQQGEMWQLNPAIRAMVQYKPYNLLDSFAGLGQFDVIFCRNVLIYFDAPTKRDVLTRLRQQLAPDGFLVLGAAETVIGLSSDFVPLEGARGIYRPNDAGASAQPQKLAVNAGLNGAASRPAATPAQASTPAGTPASNVLPLTQNRLRG
ncbi:MAG: protein-glutamate O-methyltransferase CheR [Rhodobiaceae bacterium]|nr:protein-glutamate O-methyltransferase CheR [Rhodobiaceae bacterium]MCC0053374.1 protein-glutamate O-methyltransferase CheR [Rhodobiaceae bacterium]